MPTKRKAKAKKKAAKAKPRPTPKTGESRKARAKERREGRPTTITRARIESICEYLLEGNYFETACEASGVPIKTARSWQVYGRQAKYKDTLFEEFSVAVKKAISKSESSMLATIKTMALEENQWQAMAWRLERRHPTRWGRRQAIEISGGSKAVKIEGIDSARALITKALKLDDSTTSTG